MYWRSGMMVKIVSAGFLPSPSLIYNLNRDLSSIHFNSISGTPVCECVYNPLASQLITNLSVYRGQHNWWSQPLIGLY